MSAYMDVQPREQNEWLAARIEQGDRSAENEFVRLYCDCVFRMALQRTRDREAARELMDDVLMAVVSALRRHAVRNTGDLGGFVHGTARNLINGYIRGRRRKPPGRSLDDLCASTASPGCIEQLERSEIALRALELLDGRDREIMRLSLLENMKPGEIAAALGLDAAQVRQRKCRALRAMMILMEHDGRPFRARRMLRG